MANHRRTFCAKKKKKKELKSNVPTYNNMMYII